MKGRLVVETRAAYEKYLADLKVRQDAVAPPSAGQQTAQTEPAPAAPATEAQANKSAPSLANTNP
jgi:hypothetical protein